MVTSFFPLKKKKKRDTTLVSSFSKTTLKEAPKTTTITGEILLVPYELHCIHVITASNYMYRDKLVNCKPIVRNVMVRMLQ
jgi:hypothetical protein